MPQNHLKQNDNNDDINLLDYLIVILKHKSFIIKATLGAMIIAAVISLVLPKTYRAETKILPPQKSGSSMSAFFASQMGSMGLSPSMIGMKGTNKLYVALLKTRPVLDYVAGKLNLEEYYGAGSGYKVRKILSSNLMVTDDRKSGIITVACADKNPGMSAKIANSFIEGLDNLNNRLAVTEAAQRRLFFEKQLEKAKESLIESEEDLQKFQQKTGTIKVDAEAEAAIEGTSKIKAEISAKEVELRVMRNYATEQNPDLQKLKEKISALKEQLRKFESRSSDDAIFSTKKLSALGTQYLRKMREFKYNESLYEIMLKQYESARLDESRDASIIQVVEKAEAPEKRWKPRRKKIVLNTGLVVFFFSIMLVFVRVWWENLKTESGEKVETVKKLLNLSGVKSILKKRR